MLIIIFSSSFHQPRFQILQYSWIMNAHFEGMSSCEFFMTKAARIISLCYDFFLKKDYEGKSLQKIHVPDGPYVKLSDKSVNVFSHLNNYFGAKNFKKMEDSLLSSKEIAARSVTDPSLSPLPSVLLSGNIFSSYLTSNFKTMNPDFVRKQQEQILVKKLEQIQDS